MTCRLHSSKYVHLLHRHSFSNNSANHWKLLGTQKSEFPSLPELWPLEWPDWAVVLLFHDLFQWEGQVRKSNIWDVGCLGKLRDAVFDQEAYDSKDNVARCIDACMIQRLLEWCGWLDFVIFQSLIVLILSAPLICCQSSKDLAPSFCHLWPFKDVLTIGHLQLPLFPHGTFCATQKCTVNRWYLAHKQSWLCHGSRLQFCPVWCKSSLCKTALAMHLERGLPWTWFTLLKSFGMTGNWCAYSYDPLPLNHSGTFPFLDHNMARKKD